MSFSCGVWTALVTPFDHSGNLDSSAWKKLVRRQIDGGVAGVVAAGTTGESPTLTSEEKLTLCKLATAQGSRVILGCGGSKTDDAVQFARKAQAAGADGLLVVTPPYNKPTPAGLVAHYQAIASASGLPIMAYHVPGRTGLSLDEEQLSAIMAVGGVEALKEASGNLWLFARLAKRFPRRVFCGDDPTFLASLAVGGAGLVSVMTNVDPRPTVAMMEAFGQGQTDQAITLNQGLMDLMAAMVVEVNPLPVKYAVSRLGLVNNTFRLPMVPVAPSSEKLIDRCLAELTDVN